VEVGTQFRCFSWVDRQIVIGETINGGKHFSEDIAIKAAIIFGGPLNQLLAAISKCQSVVL
jgi:hypothetical protein